MSKTIFIDLGINSLIYKLCVHSAELKISQVKVNVKDTLVFLNFISTVGVIKIAPFADIFV
jgi:hypothetical protein